jgi:hypothetical protein
MLGEEIFVNCYNFPIHLFIEPKYCKHISDHTIFIIFLTVTILSLLLKSKKVIFKVSYKTIRSRGGNLSWSGVTIRICGGEGNIISSTPLALIDGRNFI